MTLLDSNATCTVGVLDHQKFTAQFLPLVERARDAHDLSAVEEMRALVMGVPDGPRRNDLLSQLDRIDVAVQSGRWHASAAGLVLQGICVDQPATVRDLMNNLHAFTQLLYDWNTDHAERLLTFFGFLSDRTLSWCSPSDAWRAVLPPESLIEPAAALGAMTPRQLRKLLIDAEDGDICSEPEARAMAEWWEAIRTSVREGARSGEGFYICVSHPS